MTENRTQAASKPRRTSRAVGIAIAGVSLALCIVLPLQGETLGLWGLIPLLAYAVLVLVGFNILLSTGFAAVLAMVMAQLSLSDVGTLLTESLGSFIATIGLIIMLGAGLGAVARETGAASALVRGLVRGIGVDTPRKVQLGIMASSAVLVAALGTLAGANAIIAPIIIPVAARAGWSKPAVAAMIHTAGAAGLVLGPFTPPVVTIMGATGLNYFEYLYSAGLPMGVTTCLVGFFMARWIHRRTEITDPYTPEDIGEPAEHAENVRPDAKANAAAWGFVLTILAFTVLGIAISAGYTYAIIVMIATALVTSVLGKLPAERALTTFSQGAASLVWLFFLFWMFNPLLVLVEESGAYDTLMDSLTPTLQTVGPWGFLVLSLMIGWLAVPGAAVAQVTLINDLLWPLGSSLGIPPTAWAASLLGGSQIDWFGPLPNADMVGQMGLARSSNLKMMLYNGWAVMAANLVVFAIMFAVL